MEQLISPHESQSFENFSVDDILGAIETYANEASHLPDSDKETIFSKASHQAEREAIVLGDFGSVLVQEVEDFLQSSDALDFFALQAEQSTRMAIGDICCANTDDEPDLEISAQAASVSKDPSSESSGTAIGGSSSTEASWLAYRTTKNKAKKKPRVLFAGLFVALLPWF